ncbi:MAG: nuclear transport factor 2 family protein [Actinomycetota bacterium]|nr:nuclear transport factor 2 family protein [Actinomycetota bacterium]
MTQNSTITWEALPAVVTSYLTAHRSGDVEAAISTFTPDAAVTDEGHTFRGREAIAAWLGSAGSEYTYTTDFVAATTTGPAQLDVLQRLEGNFPGGVADLHYRFTLAGDAISRLVIEP